MTSALQVHGDLGVEEWTTWTVAVRLVVTDPACIAEARHIVTARLDLIDAAASRFRDDSEVSRIFRYAAGRPATVSATLADLVRVALTAAERTGGDVDPTFGSDLVALGYGDSTATGRIAVGRRATYRDIVLDGLTLSLPAGVLLDLGATAKARAADLCAEEVSRRLGCGALLSLGGDLRVAGAPPAEGWQILVKDGPDESASTIRLTGAKAVATSSTLHRRWTSGRATLHHILDPELRRPAAQVWRTASVAASTCVEANTLSTAAIVRGSRAFDLLEPTGLAARLVRANGDVKRFGGWPA